MNLVPSTLLFAFLMTTGVEAQATTLPTTRQAPLSVHDVPVLRKTALGLLNDDRPVEALALLKSLIEVAPRDADLLTFLGEAHVMLEDWHAARRAFNAAFELDPTLATRVVNRGMTLLKLGDVALADADFRRLADSGATPVLRARGFYGLGLVADERGDDAAARAAYEKSLSIDSTRTAPRYRLALQLLKSKEPASAARLLEEVVVKDALMEGVTYNLALAYEAAGDAARAAAWRAKFKSFRKAKTAIDSCRQRLRVDPNQPSVLLEMARAYKSLGANAEALGGYRRYLAAAPMDRVARFEAATLYVDVGDAVNARRELARLSQSAATDADRARITELLARLPKPESR